MHALLVGALFTLLVVLIYMWALLVIIFSSMMHLVKSLKYMVILINGDLSNWVKGG